MTTSVLPENLKPLTSLRFFAAMWVVMFHYWPKLSASVPAFVQKGYLGVELFFVLSGFILCHVYLQARGEGRFKYGSFLWARLARIYPLHLMTLLGVALLGVVAAVMGQPVDPNVTDLRALPSNILLVHAWGFSPVAGWNHPSWSISAEWFAYLSFPAFAWAAWALRKRPQLALGLTLSFLFLLYAGFERLAGFPLTQATIAWGALRIVPCFAYGCALYLAWKSGAVSRLPVAAAGATASLIGIVAFSVLGIPDAVIVALCGTLILSLAGLSRAKLPVLSSSTFVWLGEVSYSIYMICVPWKMVFPKLIERLGATPDAPVPFLVWLGVVAMLIPLAGLSYHLVEKPAREAMKRFSARRARESAAHQIA